MDVSIVISTFNRSANLEECLQCLENQKNTEHFQWEAMIVDNNSTDNTREIVNELKNKFSIPLDFP